MSLASYAQSDSSSSGSIDVIVTASGGEDMPRAAYRGGALVGINSSKKRPPDEIPVDFVDWPFLEDGGIEAKWSRHLDVVKRERPKLAVAPDINDKNPFDDVVEKADRLLSYAETVIIVPKAVKPSEVPDRFRVGMPAQDRFGGVPHSVWEYRNVPEVHILGGSPNTQFELSHYVNVESVDTASPLKAAEFGNVWNGKWSESGENYYDRIERSMDNLLKEWNDGDVDADRLGSIRFHLPQPDPCPVSDDRVAKPPGRKEMCLAGDEEVPFPGREYFHRPDSMTLSEWREEYRA